MGDRRPRHHLHRPHQPRQPDAAPRRDRVDEPVRGAAAASVRGVQPRLGQPVQVRSAQRERAGCRLGPLGRRRPSRRSLPRRRHRGQPVPAAADRRACARQPQDRSRRHGLGRHAHQDGAGIRLRRGRCSRREGHGLHRRRGEARFAQAGRRAGRVPELRGLDLRHARGRAHPQRDRHHDRADGHAVDHRELLVGRGAALRRLLRSHGHGQRPACRGQPAVRGHRGQAWLLQPRAHAGHRRPRLGSRHR